MFQIQPPFRACLADQLWFILESGPYFRQARLNGEQREFLAMYEEIWFAMWPVYKVSEDDIYMDVRKGQVREVHFFFFFILPLTHTLSNNVLTVFSALSMTSTSPLTCPMSSPSMALGESF